MFRLFRGGTGVGRYLDLATEALRERRDAAVVASRAEPAAGTEGKRMAPNACAQCGTLEWIASIVMDDGSRVCAHCLLGWVR